MKSIKELTEEKIRLRKVNPVYSTALENLIVGAQKIAKDKNRPVTEDDIRASAKSLVKNLVSVIDTVRIGPIVEGYKKEVEIYNTFLPTVRSDEDSKNIANDIIAKNTEKSIKELALLFKEHGLNMKVAMEEIKNVRG